MKSCLLSTRMLGMQLVYRKQAENFYTTTKVIIDAYAVYLISLDSEIFDKRFLKEKEC